MITQSTSSAKKARRSAIKGQNVSSDINLVELREDLGINFFVKNIKVLSGLLKASVIS